MRLRGGWPSNRLEASLPLASRTSFRIGGEAELFIEPQTLPELIGCVREARRRGMPVRILGGGTNLLVNDRGVEGLVLSTRKLRGIARRGSSLRVLAGQGLPALVARAAAMGLSGLEPLAGIPGTVGGAVAMRSGGRHGDAYDALRSACVLQDGVGRPACWSRPLLEEARSSGRLGRDVWILSVEFVLRPMPPSTIRATIDSLLRARRCTQPLDLPSAGCFFRNPSGTLGAGALIDRAGLKGRRMGGAMVSPVHANFIVNVARATARDVLELALDVRRAVQARFGVCLDFEVSCW